MSRTTKSRDVGVSTAVPAQFSGLPFQKIDRDTLYDRAYAEIRRVIMSGRIQPGALVTIRGLAAALGISTMPVRDALRRLVAERVLEISTNRGYRLRTLTPAQFEEILNIRLMLEGMIAERATQQINDEQLKELEALQAQMEAVDAAGEEFLEYNRQFHFRYYAIAEQPVALTIVESLWLQAGPLLNYYRLRDGATTALENHRSLLDALARRDGASARVAIERDLTEAGNVILSEIGAAKG
jgi:DNA-binding GntR family transcriptional regulator